MLQLLVMQKSAPVVVNLSVQQKALRWERGKAARSGGLIAGRDKINRETGSNLKSTQPEGGCKKSFCARMGGVKGPMKNQNGESTYYFIP